MNRTIEKLAMLVRLRGRECDRLRQAWQEACQAHDACTALLARRQREADTAQTHHNAALRARAEAPTDILVADYSRGQHDRLLTAEERVEQASAELVDADAQLRAARTCHQRAQLRLDLLQERLDKARLQESRRIARRIESAGSEAPLIQRLIA